jgi:flagellar biosynthesis chaperone FliJ
MNRREHIVDTVHRVAEAHEREAAIAVIRAEAAQREAAEQQAALVAENEDAEASLLGSGQLGAVERELLWAHRAWFHQQLEHSEERVALTETQVDAAKQRLFVRKQETRVRERVKDHVIAAERGLRNEKAQKELDEIATMRAGKPRG